MAENLQYELFCEKFERKKTTDDCYTPKNVYDCILEHVGEHYADLKGKRIVRPFYPDKDYRDFEYKENDIVIDNPPFSILSQIVKFYNAKGVKYFLFAPHLQIGHYINNCCLVIASADIKYENKADINTSFLTNLCEDGFVLDGAIAEKIRILQKKKKGKPKSALPNNIQSTALLGKFIQPWRILKVPRSHCASIKKYNQKNIYGGGIIISDKVVERLSETGRMPQYDQPITPSVVSEIRKLNESEETPELVKVEQQGVDEAEAKQLMIDF